MRRQGHSQHQLDHSDDDVGSTPSQILERVQPDRVTVTKPEEDRRRRTIIVEKRGGSFGFTLQSYGIHYRREQEIEMITYVDHVDAEGPASRAGMREGDVILSINGADMEKADHKTLVGFIKACEARMRMVVLFEDCVRKVELHIRYIQLQRVLQARVAELERLCARERQLLEGKWKTHSLPARKKASSSSTSATGASGDGATTPTQYGAAPYCRPTVSTEDVAHPPPPTAPTLMLAYQYLEPHCRTYVLQPSAASSGEYLLSFEPPRFKGDQHHFIVKTPCEPAPHKQSRGNQTNGSAASAKGRSGGGGGGGGKGGGGGGGVGSGPEHSHSHSYGAHLCNPCVRASHDNASLEAYDLASPCCEPHCVPSARRRSRHHRRRASKAGTGEADHHHHDHQPQTTTYQQQQPPTQQHQAPPRSRPHSQAGHHPDTRHQASRATRYLSFGAGLVSQCSLHSCTSSELSALAAAGVAESSAASYTTSLSTDTLYWDSPCDSQPRRPSKSGSGKLDPPQQQQQQQPSPGYYADQGGGGVHYQPAKPKSWDNLTTKAYGGYGFGYGYVETTVKPCPKSQHGRTHSTKSAQHKPAHSGTHRRYMQPTKSTESLLGVPRVSDAALSDSSVSCECLEAASPDPAAAADAGHFFPGAGPDAYYARRAPRPDHVRSAIVTTSSEITRL